MSSSVPRVWLLHGGTAPQGTLVEALVAAGFTVESRATQVPEVAAWARAGCPPMVVQVGAGTSEEVAAAWLALRRRGLHLPFLAAVERPEDPGVEALAGAGAVDLVALRPLDPLLAHRVRRLAARTPVDDPFLPQESCSPLVVRFVFDLQARALIHLREADGAGRQLAVSGVPRPEPGWMELLHPEDRARVAERLDELLALRDEGRWTQEVRIAIPGGEYRWMRIVAAVLDRDEAGAPRHLFGSAVDTTAIRRPEAAFAALVEGSARVGAALFPDLARALGAFLGMEAVAFGEIRDGAWIALGGWSRSAGDAPAAPSEADRAAITRGEVVRGTAPSGGGRLLLPLRGDDGAVVGAILLLHGAGFAPGPTALTVLEALLGRAGGEIDRRRSHEELRRSQERLALAVTGTDTCLWDWNLSTGEVFVDPAWRERLADLRLDSLLGEHAVADGVHPEDVDALVRAFSASVRGESEYAEAEARFRTRDGSWLWGLVRGRVVERGSDGRPLRVIGTLTDVTSRRRMEARLAAADRLATVGTLASGVAHEINNPLSYVLGNLEYVAAAWDADRIQSDTARAHLRQALAEAIEGAERVRSIVADLGLLARVEDAVSRPVDVARVVGAAIRVVAPQARRRTAIEEDLRPVPVVMGNEARLCQVVVALLANAIDAMPPDRPVAANRVRVALGMEGGMVRLSVEDNGVGMTDDVLRRALDAFFTTRAPGGGMGLGLAIVNGVVSGLGGRLELESVPDRGTVVRVYLPVGSVVAGEGKPAGRPRVLVVDDEPSIREVVTMFLSPNYDVVAVGDGEEALVRLAAGEPFDAMLADLSLPGLSGTELWDQVRERAPGLAAHTGFATGGVSAPEREALARSGGDRFLEKPFTRAELLAFVRELVGTETA